MIIASIYWLIVLFANAHFAQVARFSKDFGAFVVALSIICPTLAKRYIVRHRLKNNFHRRFRRRLEERNLRRTQISLAHNTQAFFISHQRSRMGELAD